MAKGAISPKPKGFARIPKNPLARNPVGRPSNYKPEYCALAERLGKLGKSPAGIAATIGTDKATMLRWAAANDEFATSLSRAKTYEQLWWEDHAQKNLKGKHYQSQVWRTSMAARFKDEYTERQEMAHSFNLAGLIEGLHAEPPKVIEGTATTAPLAEPESKERG